MPATGVRRRQLIRQLAHTGSNSPQPVSSASVVFLYYLPISACPQAASSSAGNTPPPNRRGGGFADGDWLKVGAVYRLPVGPNRNPHLLVSQVTADDLTLPPVSHHVMDTIFERLGLAPSRLRRGGTLDEAAPLTALAEIPQLCSSKFPTRVAPPMGAGLLRCWWSLTTHQLSKETRFLMLTWEDDVEVHALRKRGWTISAIARHTGRDRKTVRAYLNQQRTPGVRKRAAPDPFEPFVDYVTAGCSRIRICGRARCATSSRPRVRVVVSDADPADPRAQAAPGLCGVRERDRTGERGDRAPAGRGNPMGLARSADPPASWGWGVDGASAGRVAGAFGSLARLSGAGDDAAASGRRAGPDRPRPGRGDPHVAVRPDGHGLPPGVGAGHGHLRRGREALRGRGGDLPAAAGQPQGCGGEGRITPPRNAGGAPWRTR